MKKTLSLLLAIILLVACTTTAYADAEYIDLSEVPYEEYFFQWDFPNGLPYVIEPYCIYLVYCNIFARLGR